MNEKIKNFNNFYFIFILCFNLLNKFNTAFCQFLPSTNDLVGDIDYNIDTTNGQLTLNVPIGLPKGVKNLEPLRISIVYSSNSVNSESFLGIGGWSLAGISQIERCVRDVFHDGYYEKIEFDNRDKFCLDSQRLVLVNGTYGLDGSEYRLESNNRLKIVAKGNGPDYFTIFSVDNIKLTYGLPNNTNSSLFTWPLIKMEDYLGNYVDYIYQIDKLGASILLSKISYSNKVISFEYESRLNGQKISSFYNFKLRKEISKRLKYINVSSVVEKGAFFRETRYNFQYVNDDQFSLPTQKNLINSINKCARIINSASENSFKCLRPLQFSYNGVRNRQDLYEKASFNTYGNSAQQYQIQFCDEVSNCQMSPMLDINGDGSADFIATDSNCVFITLKINTNNQFGMRSCWTKEFTRNNGGWTNGFNDRDFLDLNGDRLPDLIGFINQTIYVALNQNGIKFGPAQKWCDYSVETNRSLYILKSFLDVNNDGLLDLVIQTKVDGLVYVLFNNNGTRLNRPVLVSNLIKAPLDNDSISFVPYLTDLNADGFVDYVTLSNSEQYTYYYLNLNRPGLNSSFSKYNIPKKLVDKNLWNKNSTIRFFADINKDNLPDLIGFDSNSIKIGLASLSSSMPNQLNIPTFFEYNFSYPYTLYNYLVDMNNDGYLDVVSFDCRGIYVSFGIENGELEKNPILWTDKIKTCPNSNSSLNNLQRFIIDVDGNFSPDIIAFEQDGSVKILTTFKNNLPVLNQLVDSLNNTITIEYGFLSNNVTNNKTNSNFFSDDTENFFNLYGLKNQFVKSISRTTSNLIDPKITSITTFYTYGIYKCNKFWAPTGCQYSWIEMRDDSAPDLITHIDYFGNYPLLGQVRYKKKYYKGVLVEELTNNFVAELVSFNKSQREPAIYLILLKNKTLSFCNEKNGSHISSKQALFKYDNFGNVIQSVEMTLNRNRTLIKGLTIDFKLLNNISIWFLGIILEKNLTYFYNDSSSISSYRSYLNEYDLNTRLLKTSTKLPDYTNLSIVENFIYDKFGNILHKLSTTLNGTNNRSIKYTYSNDGRRLVSMINDYGHNTSYFYDSDDNLLTIYDPNQLKAEYKYDVLNRISYQQEFDQRANAIDYYWDSSFKPISIYGISKRLLYPNGTKTSQLEANIYDSRKKQIRSIKTGFKGTYIFQDFLYNSAEQLVKSSIKYDSSQVVGSPSYILYEYDDLGRKIATYEPNRLNSSISLTNIISSNFDAFNKISITYDGLTTFKKNGEYFHIETRNELNQIISVYEPNMAIIYYEYDLFGNLAKVSNSRGDVLNVFRYNVNNQKIESVEASSDGSKKYEFNAYDELIMESDQLGRSVLYERDKLGRIVKKVDNDREIIYSYDQGTFAKNKLSKIIINYKQNSLLKNYSIEYFYDSYSRMFSKRVSYSTNQTSNVYLIDITYYSSSNKISSLKYPKNFTLFYCYNEYDYLNMISIEDPDCRQSFIWRADSYNGANILQRETLGNGIAQVYTYDSASMLINRINSFYTGSSKPIYLRQWNYEYDLRRNLLNRKYFDSSNLTLTLNENFTYDSLDRINSSYSIYYLNASDKDYRSLKTNVWQYDQLGNIENFYMGLNETRYFLDINNPQRAIKIGDNKISYDQLGNILETSSYRIEWNSYQRAKSIYKNQTINQFEYDFEDNRILKLVKSRDNQISSYQLNYLVDDVYESVVKINGSLNQTLHKYYIKIDGIVIAQHIKIEYSSLSKINMNSTTVYMHNDLSESVDTITDQNGWILKKYKYEAFENPVQSLAFTNKTNSFLNFVDSDFGDLEKLDADSGGLINMNARIYDSNLMRFLSPDAFVGNYFSPMSLNRYSYSLNNPFKFQDPSGNTPKLQYFSKKVKTAYEKTINYLQEKIEAFKSVSTAIIQKVTEPIAELINDKATQEGLKSGISTGIVDGLAQSAVGFMACAPRGAAVGVVAGAIIGGVSAGPPGSAVGGFGEGFSSGYISGYYSFQAKTILGVKENNPIAPVIDILTDITLNGGRNLANRKKFFEDLEKTATESSLEQSTLLAVEVYENKNNEKGQFSFADKPNYFPSLTNRNDLNFNLYRDLSFINKDNIVPQLKDSGFDFKSVGNPDLGTYKVAEKLLTDFKVPEIFSFSDPHSYVFLAFIDGINSNKYTNPFHLSNTASIFDKFESLNNPTIKTSYHAGLNSQITKDPLINNKELMSSLLMEQRVQSIYEIFSQAVIDWKKQDPDASVSFVGVGNGVGSLEATLLSRMIHDKGVLDPKNSFTLREYVNDIYGNNGVKVQYTTKYDSSNPLLKPGSVPQALLLYDPLKIGSLDDSSFKLASSVVSAFMPTSRDESRLPLYPIIPSNEQRFLDVKLAGTSSDISGGFLLNGLSSMSGNLGIKYLNSLFDSPQLSYLSLPTDLSSYVIHHPEKQDSVSSQINGLKINREVYNFQSVENEPIKTDKNLLLDSLNFRQVAFDSPSNVERVKQASNSESYFEITNSLKDGSKESIRLSENGLFLGQTTTKLVNDKPVDIKTIVNNMDSTYSVINSKFSTSNYQTGTINNILYENLDSSNKKLNTYTTILDNNKQITTNYDIGTNQFYVDKSSNWAELSKATGVGIDSLLASNPQYSIVSLLTPGTKIALPSVDNSRMPKINVESSPKPQSQTQHEDQIKKDVQNGYAYKTPTSSILFKNDELTSSLFTKTQQSSLVTGYFRPGNIQLDPNPRPSEWLYNNYDSKNLFMNAVSLSSIAARGTQQIYVDPIVFDLNGDGAHFTQYSNQGVLFDLDNSGKKSRTGWVSPQDGFLVVDFNGDGIINSISEMFSEYTNGSKGSNGEPGTRLFESGWTALANYDYNKDKVIDNKDLTIWNKLQVWIDANHDGKSWIDINQNEIFDYGELSELFSLAELSITQIDLIYIAAEKNEMRDGNRLLNIGRFKRFNTIWMEAVDIDFVSDLTRHEVKSLAKGKMIISKYASDDNLENNTISTVKTYISLNDLPNQVSDQVLNATNLGVNNIYGGDNDEKMIADSKGSWLAGGGGSNTYKGSSGDDVFVITGSDKQENIDGGDGTNMAILSGDKPVTINMAQSNIHIAQAGNSDAVIISGGRTGVYIKGGFGFNTLIGGLGDDVIVGGRGKNLIIGGRGRSILHSGLDDDIIYGALNDTIVFLGGGNDQVFCGPGNDVIKLGMGYSKIDGGEGTNIVELQGSYADYLIEKLPNSSFSNAFEYRITDRQENRNGIALIKRIHKLTFNDISAVSLDSKNPVPVADVINVPGCISTTTGEKIVFIRAAQILSNDIILNSVGSLKLSELSDPIGGRVRFANANEKILLANKSSIVCNQNDVVFTCFSSQQMTLMLFKYTIVDSANNPAGTVHDLNTGSAAPMRAKVYILINQISNQSIDPLLTYQSYLNDIRVFPVWKDGYSGQGVRIGQFEPGGEFSTGPEILNYNHPDLVANIDTDWLTWDSIPTSFSDHATTVAGVMVAAKNDIGITGIAFGAKIAGYYLSNDGKDLTALSRTSSFDVINHSWSFARPFEISNLYDRGVVNTVTGILANTEYSARNGRGGLGTVCVTSGGNSRAEGGSSQGSFTNNNRFCIQVGAVNALPDLSILISKSQPFSNAGASLLVSAPGNEILTTSQMIVNDQGGIHGNDYKKSLGTSFAAPIVSATVALLLEANPKLTYRDVQAILALTAYRIYDINTIWSTNMASNWNGGGMHISHDYGFGHIDTRAAVRLAETWLVNLGVNDEVLLDLSSSFINVTAPNSSSLTIISNIRIEHVEIDVYLNFSNLGDVSLVLISPSATQSILLDRLGKIPPGFPGAAASDLGDQRSGQLQYTFMSTRHWSESSAGEWKLQIIDATPSITPVRLIKWTLRVFGNNLTADDTYFYTDEFNNASATDQKRKTLNDAINGIAGGRNTLNAAAISGDVIINLLTSQANLNGATLSIVNADQIQNLISGDGNDILIAGSDKCMLYAGRGFNLMTGGMNKDIFVVLANKYRTQGEMDTINGFNITQGDILIIIGLKCKTFNDLLFSQVNGTDTRITWGSPWSQSILLRNTQIKAFNSQNVILQRQLALPLSYLNSLSNGELILPEGNGVVKLNGSSFFVQLTFENNQLKWSLGGTIFKRDPKSVKTRFIVLPLAKNTSNYGNAIQGFIPGVDKLDLSLLGIINFASISLVKRDRGVVNGLATIHGVEIQAHLALDSPPEFKATIAYLDTLDLFQLGNRDFIFASSSQDLLNSTSDINCFNICSSAAGNMCKNNGTCFQPDLDSDLFTCTCLPGFNGTLCENMVNMCPISKNPCLNNGVCLQTGANSFNCTCKNGTSGKLCENVVNLCASQPCLNNAVCKQPKSDQFECICPYGYYGNRCENLASMCVPNPCTNNGECSELAPGAYRCKCPNGFSGTKCERIDAICDVLKPCLNNGTCKQIGSDGFICTCSNGFNGTFCEKSLKDMETKYTTTTTKLILDSPLPKINFCPQMWPQCQCSANYILYCDNFSRFDELNFNNLRMRSLNFKLINTTFLIRLVPTKKLILNASFNSNGLEVYLNQASLYWIRIENVIGFDLNSNPFAFLNKSIKFNNLLTIVNSKLDFYDNGVPFESSRCTYEYFSKLNGRGNLFKSFAEVQFLTSYPKDGICPFLFSDWNPLSVQFLINTTDYSPSLMYTRDIVNVNFSNDVILSTYQKNISIDLNMIDQRLIINAIALYLPYANYTKINETFLMILSELNYLFINAFNFADLIKSNNNWFKYLNFRLSSLNPTNDPRLVTLKKRFEHDYYYFLVRFPVNYTFPEEDFCLFKDFPIENLIYPLVYSSVIGSKTCSCTLLYLVKNWLSSRVKTSFLYNEYFKLISCVNWPNIYVLIENCNFEAKLLECVPPTTTSTSTTTTTVKTSSTSTKITNFCPLMRPYCYCPEASSMICNNFERFDQLNFKLLDPQLLKFIDNGFFTISLRPTKPLIFDSSFSTNGLEIIKNTQCYYFIRIMNIIGFDLNANPFDNFALYRPSDIEISNSTLNFYFNGSLFNQSQCSSAFFSSILKVKPLFKSFTSFKLLFPIQYPSRGFCPYIIGDWQYTKFYIDSNTNYPKLMNITENLNLLSNFSDSRTVVLDTYSSNYISIDSNFIDMRLISNAKSLFLPFVLYYNRIETRFFGSFNNLNYLYIDGYNFGNMMKTSNSWLKYLNYRVANLSMNLDNATEVKNLIDQSKFLLIQLPYSYQFPIEDFCLFKDFPHNRLVYAYVSKGKSCSCTLLYVLKNWLPVLTNANYLGWKKQYLACISSANITQMIQACDFSSRLLSC